MGLRSRRLRRGGERRDVEGADSVTLEQKLHALSSQGAAFEATFDMLLRVLPGVLIAYSLLYVWRARGSEAFGGVLVLEVLSVGALGMAMAAGPGNWAAWALCGARVVLWGVLMATAEGAQLKQFRHAFPVAAVFLVAVAVARKIMDRARATTAGVVGRLSSGGSGLSGGGGGL